MFAKKKVMELAKRLFGNTGKDCLNLYSSSTGGGLLGEISNGLYQQKRKIVVLEESVERLTEKIEELMAKKVTKKKKSKK